MRQSISIFGKYSHSKFSRLSYFNLKAVISDISKTNFYMLQRRFFFKCFSFKLNINRNHYVSRDSQNINVLPYTRVKKLAKQFALLPTMG